MKRVLNYGLENFQENLGQQAAAKQEEIAGPGSDFMEADLAEQSEVVQELIEESENNLMVLEAVQEQEDLLDELRRAGQSTPGLEAFAQTALRHQLLRLGMDNQLGLEAMSMGLEGSNILTRAGNRIIQGEVVNWKQFVDSITEWAESSENRRKEYESRLAKTEAEYRQKRDRFDDDEHDGNMAALGIFFFIKAFAPDEGVFDKATRHEKDPIQAIFTDVAYSKYLLDTWPKHVMDYMKRLIGLIKGARIKSDKDMVSLVKRIEGLGQLTDQFRTDLLDSGRLLDMCNLKVTKGKARSIVRLGDVNFDTLAGQGSGKFVKASYYMGRKVGKTLHTVVGGYGRMVDDAMAPSFKYTTEDIEQAIKGGRAYLQNVETYDKHTHAFANLYKEFAEALVKFQSSNELTSAQTKVARQFQFLGTTVKLNFTNPCGEEAQRALRGARYSNYLALRLIASAS
jgi:hypothetical protein